jgi:hypothetical protein
MAPRSGKDIPFVEIVPTVEPIQQLILQARMRGPNTVDQLLVLMKAYFQTMNEITKKHPTRCEVSFNDTSTCTNALPVRSSECESMAQVQFSIGVCLSGRLSQTLRKQSNDGVCPGGCGAIGTCPT